MNRRSFAKTSAIGLSGTSIFPFIRKSSIAPSDQIRVGVIGANGMGWSNMNAMLTIPEVQCVAVADVDDAVFAKRSKSYAEKRDNTFDTYKDYRKMLERDDIDIVIIGTPDHWHCLNFTDALSAGKHVYCEKPLANSIEEAYIMMAAAEKSDKMVQIGQWQRSGLQYEYAKRVLDSGMLGQIRLVKIWAYQGWMKPVNVMPDGSPPAGVDYDMWLGPAPKRAFNGNRFHFNFRWFWDYAGGLMTDWGVHEIDIALYFMNATRPKSVVASGGKLAYPNDASETPDTLQAIFEFEDFNMLWEHATGIDIGPYGEREGIAFIGNNGTLMVNRGGYKVMEERQSRGYSEEGAQLMPPFEDFKLPENAPSALVNHQNNFITAIRTNDASILKTPIHSGANAAIVAHMGNVAFKTKSKVFWDDSSRTFMNNAEANAVAKPNYHNGWELPG